MPLKIYWMAVASNRQKPISVDAHILLAKESGYYSLGRVRKKKSCPGKKRSPACTQATPSEPTYHAFPYKTWQTIKMRNKKLARLGGSPYHHKRVIRLDSRLHINPLACPVGSTWSRWNNGQNAARGLLEHRGQRFCSLKCSLLKSNSWFGCWESDPSTWERFSSYKQALVQLVIHFVNGEINAED